MSNRTFARPYGSVNRTSKTPILRSAISRFMPNRDEDVQERTFQADADPGTDGPYEELTQQFDFQDLVPKPMETRQAQEPIETSTEEIMQIIGPRARNGRKPADAEPAETTRNCQFRGKILTAPTPDQLETKLNQYLHDIETNRKLNGVFAKDVQYSSNNQGYSVLILMGMNPDAE